MNRGGHVIDTDIIAREVVEPGQPGLEELRQAFGETIINGDGTLNREALRAIMISDGSKRRLLDSILHPHINNRVLQRIEHHRNNDDGKPVIIDVPLLFEAGWDKLFGKVIVVHVSREAQIERLMKRDGIDRATAEATIATQMSVDEKKKKAGIVIDNSGSMKDTEIFAKKVFDMLCREW